MVEYSNEWHNDGLKGEGGWSLELIDPQNPCGEANNWGSSIDISGGTPGRENSIHGLNPDLNPPVIYSITIENDTSVRVTFTEKMAFPGLANPLSFYADQGLGFPIVSIPVRPDYRSVILSFPNKIEEETVYTLEINDTLMDCSGNVLSFTSRIRFAIPTIPESMDIVINEVLTDPFPGGEDFIEIYNRSQQVFDLKHLVLATYDTITGHLQQSKDVIEIGFLFFPEDYITLTRSPQSIKEQYFTTDSSSFIEMASFPGYPNDKGIVTIARKNDHQIIDIFEYAEDLHFDVLNSSEGISLERISFNRLTSDDSNWHSAAETAGFATPGYKNSQFIEFTAKDIPVTVDPKVFSPDNDGYHDILKIQYQMTEPGYLASVRIFNSGGKLVRLLANNIFLEMEGVFTWDGINDNKEAALEGIYIICFKIFNLRGEKMTFKNIVVFIYSNTSCYLIIVNS